MVPGMVAERCITLVYGEGKVGKGYWTLASVMMPMVRAGYKVCLFALEDKHVVPERALAYVAHHDLDKSDLDLRIVVRGSVNLLDGASVEQLVAAVGDADVVVIDPLRIAIAGPMRIRPRRSGQ